MEIEAMTGPFKVIYLKSVKDKTQEAYRRYRDEGLAEPFTYAAATIDSGLRNDPRTFGDPCYSSPQLQLDIFVRAVFPLVVHYGVHQVRAIVFVHHLHVLEL
jgi:hypothetical protein